MHELGITRNIVSIVGDAARGRRVRCVTVEIGKLSGVMSDAVAFCFEVVAQGTTLDGADLVIHEVEGRASCSDCGTEFSVATLFEACPCGSKRLTRLAGEELKIKTMELVEAT